MSKTVSKDTIMRLLKDVKQIIQHPLTENGIFYLHDEEDMLKGYALIIGPEDTPYFGGYYFFQFDFPADYPYSPPKLTILTNGRDVRFNPNLYKCGKVCISILNTWHGEQWSACQTITTVLLTLCTLFIKNPLLNEPGVYRTHTDFNKYNEIIEYANLEIAVCDILERKKGVYIPEIMDRFRKEVDAYAMKNRDRWIEFCKEKEKEKEKDKQPYLITTHIYHMRMLLDYESTLKRLVGWDDTKVQSL